LYKWHVDPRRSRFFYALIVDHLDTTKASATSSTGGLESVVELVVGHLSIGMVGPSWVLNLLANNHK
jgi:hypothetical protein